MSKTKAKGNGGRKSAFQILPQGSSSSKDVLITLDTLSTSASAAERLIIDKAKRMVESSGAKSSSS